MLQEFAEQNLKCFLVEVHSGFPSENLYSFVLQEFPLDFKAEFQKKKSMEEFLQKNLNCWWSLWRYIWRITWRSCRRNPWRNFWKNPRRIFWVNLCSTPVEIPGDSLQRISGVISQGIPGISRRNPCRCCWKHSRKKTWKKILGNPWRNFYKKVLAIFQRIPGEILYEISWRTFWKYFLRNSLIYLFLGRKSRDTFKFLQKFLEKYHEKLPELFL